MGFRDELMNESKNNNKISTVLPIFNSKKIDLGFVDDLVDLQKKGLKDKVERRDYYKGDILGGGNYNSIIGLMINLRTEDDGGEPGFSSNGSIVVIYSYEDIERILNMFYAKLDDFADEILFFVRGMRGSKYYTNSIDYVSTKKAYSEIIKEIRRVYKASVENGNYNPIINFNLSVRALVRCDSHGKIRRKTIFPF